MFSEGGCRGTVDFSYHKGKDAMEALLARVQQVSQQQEIVSFINNIRSAILILQRYLGQMAYLDEYINKMNNICHEIRLTDFHVELLYRYVQNVLELVVVYLLDKNNIIYEQDKDLDYRLVRLGCNSDSILCKLRDACQFNANANFGKLGLYFHLMTLDIQNDCGIAPRKRTYSEASNYKTVLCRRYMNTGRCRLGEYCDFAHGASDIRTHAPCKYGSTCKDSDCGYNHEAKPLPMAKRRRL